MREIAVISRSTVMKIRVITALLICALGLSGCNFSTEYSSTEQNDIPGNDKEAEEPIFEEKKEEEEVIVAEVEEDIHLDKEDYSPVLYFFSQIDQDITYNEINDYASENGLFCEIQYYSGDEYEVKIASDPKVSVIGRYAEKGENVDFIFNADDTLAYAEYSDDMVLRALFFGYGYGLNEPRKMTALGWGEEKETGKWYYFDADGVVEVDTAESAIDGFLNSATD